MTLKCSAGVTEGRIIGSRDISRIKCTCFKIKEHSTVSKMRTSRQVSCNYIVENEKLLRGIQLDRHRPRILLRMHGHEKVSEHTDKNHTVRARNHFLRIMRPLKCVIGSSAILKTQEIAAERGV
jgi:hypothetical protein